MSIASLRLGLSLCSWLQMKLVFLCYILKLYIHLIMKVVLETKYYVGAHAPTSFTCGRIDHVFHGAPFKLEVCSKFAPVMAADAENKLVSVFVVIIENV